MRQCLNCVYGACTLRACLMGGAGRSYCACMPVAVLGPCAGMDEEGPARHCPGPIVCHAASSEHTLCHGTMKQTGGRFSQVHALGHAGRLHVAHGHARTCMRAYPHANYVPHARQRTFSSLCVLDRGPKYVTSCVGSS